MKILMVNKFLYPCGGAEKYMISLGEHLKTQGHQVEYFGMEHKDNVVGNTANIYTSNMDFHSSSAVSNIKNAFKTIYSVEAKKKIEAVLNDFKPDIVHLNNFNFQLTPSIIAPIKDKNLPIVQTVHDVQIACPNHMMYIESTNTVCSKCIEGNYFNCVKNKCVHTSFLKSYIAYIESSYAHKSHIYDNIDCFICPSKFMADTLKKASIKEEKLKVLTNFVALNDNGNQHTIDDIKPQRYILYFGRLSVEKGIKTLVDVVKELPDINLVVAGTGPLDSLCREVKNIQYIGFKEKEELSRLIKNAEFSIYPSEWYENCPISIVESLALGTPVIASDLGGSKELVDNNKTGIIFKAKDKESLKNSIKNLWYDNDKLMLMSKAAKDKKQLNINDYYDKIISIYSSLIK